jgi:hypothetical protein
MMIDLLFSAGKNDFTFLLALCRLSSVRGGGGEENKKKDQKNWPHHIMVY